MLPCTRRLTPGRRLCSTTFATFLGAACALLTGATTLFFFRLANAHSRDLQADFLRSFGAESDTVPPFQAIVVGTDADNTGGTGLGYVGYVGDLSLMKQ